MINAIAGRVLVHRYSYELEFPLPLKIAGRAVGRTRFVAVSLPN